MKIQEARDLGARTAACVAAGEIEKAYGVLAPVLAQRTPFAKLGVIGEAIGSQEPVQVNRFLDRVASDGTEGGWVVIGAALSGQLEGDMPAAFERCRRYIVTANVWYGADILGERVPGPALVRAFDLALISLASWRDDDSIWVRRAVGVSAHFWAKRSRGREELAFQAEALLAFLAPMFEEWEMPAVKGIGWGLKTLGRNYPELVVSWLARQLSRPHRALMLRKAVTYLSAEQQATLSAFRANASSVTPA